MEINLNYLFWKLGWKCQQNLPDQVGPIWTQLDPTGPIWTPVDLFRPIYGHIWTHLDSFVPI